MREHARSRLSTVDHDRGRYLECLRELIIILELGAPNRKPTSFQFQPDLDSVRDQVKKRIASLMDHDLVKQNHWQKKGLELFSKYDNSC